MNQLLKQPDVVKLARYLAASVIPTRHTHVSLNIHKEIKQVHTAIMIYIILIDEINITTAA